MVISFGAYHVILDKPPIQQWLSYLHKIEQLRTVLVSRGRWLFQPYFRDIQGLCKFWAKNYNLW